MDGYLRTLLRSGAILLLVAGVSGCSGGPTPTPGPQPTTTTSESPFPTPDPEPTPTPEPTTTPPDDDPPVLSLPSLPIGGQPETDDDDPARQCVHISWIVNASADPGIPKGYAAEITGAKFSGKGFEVINQGCGSSAPNCIGLIMRFDNDACDLAVRALPDADPATEVRVSLTGILYCPKSVGMAGCRDFAKAVANESDDIPLDPAPQPTSDPEPEPEPEPDNSTLPSES